MTLPTNSLYSCVIHGLCVLTGVTHATPFVMRAIHFCNMFTRLALLCVGITLFNTHSHRCVSGLVMSPYNASKWNDMTPRNWTDANLPMMEAVVGPGNVVVVALWFTCVVCFVINDGLRCVLVFQNMWFTCENHMDMSWSTLTCTAIPLLFACGAVQLGTRDIFVLGTIIFITVVSGVCGAITEHLRTLVNPHNIHNFSQNVLRILRVTQDVSLIIAAQLVTLPFVMNSMDLAHPMASSDMITSILFTCLTYGITITSYRHHRLCSIFEQTWPLSCSMGPWGSSTVATTATTQEPGILSRSTSTVDDPKPAFKSLPYGIQPLCFDGRSSMNGTNVVSTDTEAGQCHLWHSASADIVHIVDQDHRVVTVQLTEDFNIYNQLHEPVTIARCGVLATGLHIATIGAAPQIFHAHIDEGGGISRRMIGSVTEWRRYYIIDFFIDAILFTILLDMTILKEC